MRLSRPLSLLLVGAMLVPAFVLADNDSSASSSATSGSSQSSSAPDSSKGRRGRTLQPVVAGCIQMAVDVREQSVLTAVTAYTTSIVSAFQQKKSALHNAWAITDSAKRKAALKNAWTLFAKSKKSARQTYKNARQTAWSAFQKSVKACNESMSDESYKANEDL